MIPPSKLWGRVPSSTYVYEGDDPRPARILHDPEWTEDDVALMRGLDIYEETLCPGCRRPKRLAWHKHTEAEWDPNPFVCHACSAEQGKEVVYASPTLGLSPERLAQLPPWDFETMTSEPTKQATPGG